jgi:hypothetical protein
MEQNSHSSLYQRKKDIDLGFHWNLGNHKSIEKFKAMMDPLVNKDINHGFALPLPVDILYNISKASLAPLGCHKQETINELGIKVPKYRMTHDQSFPGPSGLLVNLRVKKEALPPIMYSSVLLRLKYYCAAYDLIILTLISSFARLTWMLHTAYRRGHLSSDTAKESLIIYDNILLMALRMTLGGTLCPSLWGYIAETLADEYNTLLQNWDHISLLDPMPKEVDSPQSLPDSLPFHPALPLSVEVPTNDIGKVDIFLDNSIGITLEINDNAIKVNQAIHS